MQTSNSIWYRYNFHKAIGMNCLVRTSYVQRIVLNFRHPFHCVHVHAGYTNYTAASERLDNLLTSEKLSIHGI